jgi:hypothetical protein
MYTCENAILQTSLYEFRLADPGERNKGENELKFELSPEPRTRSRSDIARRQS